MKKSVALALLLTCALPVFGQGTINFVNRIVGVVDAPVFDLDGSTRLSGPAYLAQLYAGLSEAALAPVGAPLPFRTGAGVGYLDATLGSTRAVPNTSPGQAVFAQVRAWEAAKGATFEAALAAGGKNGVSLVFTVATGGNLIPPAPLAGLQSFRLQNSSPPVITTQPQDIPIGLGGKARFEVVASGPPPFTYQWRKGSNPIPGATGRILEFPSVTTNDAGSYSVRVSNAFGGVESKAATLTILPLPVITQMVVSSPALVGRPLHLEAIVAGNGPFTYQWRRNRNDIPGAITSVYDQFSALAGDYHIRVTGSGGSTEQFAVTISTNFALDVTAVSGGNVTITPPGDFQPPGTTVRLQATAESGYVFSQWTGDLTGSANPSSLVMNNHKRVEAIFVPLGGTVHFANRNLGLGLDAPVFDVDGTTRLAGPGFVAQLYAGPTLENLGPAGSPIPFRSGDGAGYFPDQDRAITTVDPGEAAYVQMRVWEVALGSTYEAAVAAGGRFGAGNVVSLIAGNKGNPPTLPTVTVGFTSFSLRRGAAPTIITQPRPLQIGIGATAHFEVVALGSAPLGYQWRKGSNVIAGATGPAFEIKPVAATDAGNYSVRITNSFGATNSLEVALVVVPPPTISRIIIGAAPLVGRPLHLEVIAEGPGPLSYQWRRDGNDLPNATSSVFDLTSAIAGAYSIRVTGPGGTTEQLATTVSPDYALEVGGASGGTVSVTPPGGFQPPGTRVRLLATADPGYVFTSWTGDLTGTVNPADLVMNGHKRVDALFTPLGGTVHFVNRNLGFGLDAPVFDVDGSTRLAGEQYVAQLYAGPAVDSLAAIGPPIPFRSGDGAGYVPGADRSIIAVPPGQTAQVQMRAWDLTSGSTYEAAVASGGRHGAGNIVALVTGNVGNPPTPPTVTVGFTSFSLRIGSSPVIVRQPEPAQVGLGGLAHFEVEALGSEPLAYQWRKGVAEIAGATQRTLDVNRVTAADAGTYSVRVSNAFGSTNSLGATLTIVVAPVISDVLVSTNPLVGRALRLEAVVTGAGPFTYQWLRNGSAILDATDAVYSTASAAVGAYSLRVTGPGGTTAREVITISNEFALELVPSEGGTVTAAPARETYAAGTVVTITATSDPGYAFAAWAGDLTGTSNPNTITMGGHRRVEALFAPTAGTVYFLNHNLALDIDSPVFDTNSSTLLSGPGFVAQLYAGPTPNALAAVGAPVPFQTGEAAGYFEGEVRSIPTVRPGDMAHMQVRAWELAAGATYEEATQTGGKHGTSPTLTVITGNAGSPPSLPAFPIGLASFSLVQGSTPIVRTPPADLTVIAGQSAVFRVVAEGTPAPQFQWRKNGVPIPGATSDRFEIAVTSPADAGLYSVRVYSASGEVIPPAATLAVITVPVIGNVTPSQTVLSGDDVALEATAIGSLPLTYQWFLGESGDESRPVGEPGARLVISGLRASASYWVRISNAAGTARSTTVRLTVDRRPQTITFAPIPSLKVGDAAVSLAATASSGLPVTFSIDAGSANLSGNLLSVPVAGRLVVRATQAGDASFQPAPPAVQEVTIAKGKAIVILSRLEQTFDGSPRRPDASVTPPGLVLRMTFDGSPGAPTAVGDYLVAASVEDPNFAGQATGTLRIVAAVNVAGLVYLDTDGNGVRDPGNAGISDVTVRLVAADGATQLRTATTDREGRFSFSGVASGSYYIVEQNPVGFASTTPDLRPLVVHRETVAEVEFGDQAVATLAGVVFEDLDGNGSRGEGEKGLAGVTIRLTGGNASRTAMTTADGSYLFTTLSPDSYTVEEIDPVGYVSTTPNVRTVSVASGGSATASFGDQSSGTIGGLVFLDANGNGLRDPSEPGLSGVSIRLTGPNGQEVASTLADGSYLFDGILPGSYKVEETDPLGYVSTTPNVRTLAVSGGGAANANFGDQAGGTVGGFVFEDRDGNGLPDPGEPGIGGVTIRITGGPGQRTTTTSGQGSFLFTDIAPGSYSVEEIDPVGYSSSTPNVRMVSVTSGGAANATFADQAAGTLAGTVFEDINGNGSRELGEPGIGGVAIRLAGAAGQKTTITSVDGAFVFAGTPPGTYSVEETDPVGFSSTTSNTRTVNLASGGSATALFGDQAAGTVSGVVFDDVNGNGIREPGEAGLGRVSIRLTGSAGQRTTVTTGDGSFQFATVVPGSYTVEEIDPAGFSSTTPNQRSVALTSGGAATASFGDQAAGSIAGVVFTDLNGNGLREPGEGGIGGVQVRVVGTSGQYSILTSGDGTFQFPALTPGSYTVEETDPTGFASTTPNLRAVSLGGGTSASASFGDQPVQTISGVVFEDQNGNTTFDSGEPGIGGVRILLLRAADSSPAGETSTSGAGLFVFSDVPAGNYRVRQAVPSEYTVLAGGQLALADVRVAAGSPMFVEKPVQLATGGAASVSFGNNVVGALTGSVFNDLDGSGVLSAGEAGLGGVEVEVRQPASGLVVATATTSGNGLFLVSGLTPGASYQVGIKSLTGFASAQPLATVSLTGGAATVNFPLRAVGTISGRAFNDENGNGMADPLEPGLGGIHVSVIRNSTGQRLEFTTSGDGSFLLTGVASGEFRTEAIIPAGFRETTSTNASLTLLPGAAASALFGLASESVRPPVIVTEPPDLTLAEGATGTLAVVATGTPPLQYQWLKNGTPIPDATASTLHFDAVRPADDASYQVRVRNGAGSALSRTARLAVNGTSGNAYESWAEGQGLPANQRQPGQDPDGDRLPNLLEFMLGTNPLAPTADGGPSPVVVTRNGSRFLGFELHTRVASSLRISLEASSNLVQWARVATTPEISGTDAAGDLLRLVDTVPFTSGSHRFVRLGIDLAPAAATPAVLRVISGPPIVSAFQLALEGQPGRTYSIERSDDLKNWTFLRDVQAGDNAVTFADQDVSGVPSRFYRAVAR